MTRNFFAYVFCGLLIVFFCVEVCAQETRPVLTERVIKLLGQIPKGVVGNLIFSPDGERMAYVLQVGKKQVVVCEDKRGPECDHVLHPVFSPDSRRLAYSIRQEEQTFFFLFHGEEEGLRPGHFSVFSPDGKHYAWRRRQGKQGQVVADGKAGPWIHYVHADSMTYSPDGKRLAYTGQGVGVVLDGQVQPGINGRDPTFSPDSKHFAYRVEGWKGGKRRQWVVLDGMELAGYGEVESLTFSPDSRHFAYYARDNQKCVLVWDGKELYKWVNGPGRITFSPDSQHMIYATDYVPPMHVWLNGRLISKDHETISEPVFSPDSKHLAYATSLHRYYTKDKRQKVLRLLCDGREGVIPAGARRRMVWRSSYESGSTPIFPKPVWSADGKHLVYAGHKERFFVVDGLKTPEHDEVRIPTDYLDYPKTLRYVAIDREKGEATRTARLVEVDWPKDLDWTNGLKPVEHLQEE